MLASVAVVLYGGSTESVHEILPYRIYPSGRAMNLSRLFVMPYRLTFWDGVSLGVEVAVERGAIVGAGGIALVDSSAGVAGTPHAERINIITVNISKFFFIFVISCHIKTIRCIYFTENIPQVA
jgi:hypothetical protein